MNNTMTGLNLADLTKVGSNTPTGNFMRQFWIPICLSTELKKSEAPVRLMIFGEKLIGFRDEAGNVGIMDHRCPHRGASLFLGRNEGDGIRCCYHGWKFNTEGACTEMPSVPEKYDFKDRVCAQAYRAQEKAGIVWVYMGQAQDNPPELPNLEALNHPNPTVWCLLRKCNWLQALEGDIDTAHVGYLHLGGVNTDDLPTDNPMRPITINRAPEYSVEETGYGARYGAYRKIDGQISWRIAHFLYPFWTQTPNIDFHHRAIARAWVPVDDQHVMLFDISCGDDDGNPAYTTVLNNGESLSAARNYLPNGTGWYERWRAKDGEYNDWGMSRELQMTSFNFTGISNFTMQDQAITESMGQIVDHAIEHLAPSDQMVARVRRRLLQAVGESSKELNSYVIPDQESYINARSGSAWSDEDMPFTDVYENLLVQVKRW